VLAVVGLVGTFSRRTATEVPTYMPSYIQELAQEERIKGELELAFQVQATFLPRHMPKVEGLDVAAMCLPALEIGGDYYDFVTLDGGRLAVVVGDVSGKGIQAAFYMTLVKGFLQTLCRIFGAPAEVLRRLNVLFCENVPRGTFISMIYGVLDVEARTFTFARAGHNPVILKRSPSQDPELSRPAGLAIGLVTGPRFDNTIAEATLHLRPGDVLVFYTDGFSEAMNARKELYGDERLAQRVSEVGQRSAAEILRAVSEDVHHFMEAAGRHDDMTMVVIKLRSRTSYTPGSAVHVEHAEA
jgi:sigma-B regulation protein RsbU (phosphoserine phosphatase)